MMDQIGDEKRRQVSSMAPNWSKGLPEELIIYVAKRLTDSLQDFIFFSAVCKSWRSAATEVKEKHCADTGSRFLTHQVPLLLLPLSYSRRRPLKIIWHPVLKIIMAPPRDKSEKMSGVNKAVEFYSLQGKGKMRYKLNLRRLLSPETKRIGMCFSSFGWLVIVSEAMGYKWNLLHPLNHAKIELPDGRACLQGNICFTIQKFALSLSPSWTSNYIVMFHSFFSFAFCRPGLGENWTRINLGENYTIMDLSVYKEQFYFLYHSGGISVFDIDKAEMRVVAPEFPKEQLLGPNVRIKEGYLVESAGVLLVVLFTTNTNNDGVLTTGCRVFEVPFTNSKSWSDSEVKSLGNRTIFLSQCSSSFSIEASDYCYSTCKPNCIYFMNNKAVFPGERRDMGVFNMEDGTIQRSDFDKFFNYKEPRGFHLWIQPSL